MFGILRQVEKSVMPEQALWNSEHLGSVGARPFLAAILIQEVRRGEFDGDKVPKGPA